MHSAFRSCALLAVVIGSSCAGADHFVSSPRQSDEASAPVVLADLCAAQDASGDPAAVHMAFARVHGPLHDLARDVEGRDRQTAARLLEDKQQVESALDRSPERDRLAMQVADLVESTRRALQAVGSPAPPCG